MHSLNSPHNKTEERKKLLAISGTDARLLHLKNKVATMATHVISGSPPLDAVRQQKKALRTLVRRQLRALPPLAKQEEGMDGSRPLQKLSRPLLLVPMNPKLSTHGWLSENGLLGGAGNG
jgi:hypothetical protein